MSFAILESIINRIQCERCKSAGNIQLRREPNALLENPNLPTKLKEGIEETLEYEDGLILQCACGQIFMMRWENLVERVKSHKDELSSWLDTSIIKFEDNKISISEEMPKYELKDIDDIICPNCGEEIDRDETITTATKNKVYADVKNTPREYESHVICPHCDQKIEFIITMEEEPFSIRME